MTVIRNPFDAGGYSLAEMTEAINILPNLYTRLGELGLFEFEGVTQRSVIIEQYEGVLSLLPTVPWGSPATVGTREGRSMRSFAIPHIPHDDAITAADLQGVPALGSDQPDLLATVMNRKLTLMRRKHAATREYMEVNALRGIVKDGAGTTLYNYFTEFGLVQQSADFKLGTSTTDIQAVCRSVTAMIEDELQGETMTSVHALCSQGFMDKLLAHKTVREAYQFYQSGLQPLRENVVRRFPFMGIMFEEYRGSVTKHGGSTEPLIPANEGIAFPMGTMDTFKTYGAPADLLETANSIGLPMYARQLLEPKGRWIDLMTQANILPLNKRPRLCIKLHTST
jgi:hypothetical protein